MSQSCPVCKTRLWTDPLFTPVRLECPRCGAVFRPTVPWVYFRAALLLLIVLTLVLVAVIADRQLSLFLLVILGVLVSLWFLPKLIDLQREGGEMHLADELDNLEGLKLRLEDANWNQAHHDRQQEVHFRRWVYVLIGLVIILLVVSLRKGF